MTIVFCSYVFGPEWQDIKYYKKVDKALETMINDYKSANSFWIKEFEPFIVSYSLESNEILEEKDVWKVRILKDENDGPLKTKDGCKFSVYCTSAKEEWG